MAARSPLAVASKKRRTMALFSSTSDDTAASFSPGQPAFFSNGLATTYMMPPGGVWRIVQRLIHRSAWRDCPKRVRGACPVALQSTKTALFDPFLPPSTSKFALRALFVPLFGQSLHALCE